MVIVGDRTTRDSTWEEIREVETSMEESKPRSGTGEKRGLDATVEYSRDEGFGTTLDGGGTAPGSPESSTMCSSKFKGEERPGEYRLGSAGRA